MRDDLKLSDMRRRMETAESALGAAQMRIKELETDAEDADRLRENMARILTDTANALKGKPEPRMQHSWHDLADWGQKLRDVAMHYLAATSPGATHIEREHFVLALAAWRALYGRDLFETALAFEELDKDNIYAETHK
jgi:hypothetical protein